MTCKKQLSELPKPADFEATCWLTAFHLHAEEVVLAGTHRAIVEPPLGTVQFSRKSLCRLLRPEHPPLWSLQAVDKVQENPPSTSKHTLCLLTSWRDSASLRWVVSEEALNAGPDVRCEEIGFGFKWNKPGRWRVYRPLRDEAVGPSRAFHRWFPRPARRCGKRNMMFTSTFCCSSCKFSYSLQTRNCLKLLHQSGWEH